MRIISDFHDYYDAVMKTGMDKNVIYSRTNVGFKVINKNFPPVNYNLSVSSNNYVTLSTIYLGYCGQIIPLVKYENKDQVVVFNNIKSLEEFSDRVGLKLRYKKSFFSRIYWDSSNLESYDDFFKNKETDSLKEFFFKYNVPLFLYYKEKDQIRYLVTNPKLLDLNFQKFKDPYTVFQDISQYVSGVLLTNQNPMVTISDKDKVYKHGFNKWSFRKPGKKGMK